MAAGLVLSWREDVTVAAAGDGMLVVEGPGARMSLRGLAPILLDGLRRCAPPGEDEDRLAELIRAGANGLLARWYYCVERLSRHGLLCHSAYAGRDLLATLVAVATSFVARPDQFLPGRRYVLSRFAHLRRSGEEAILESPLVPARILLKDGRAAALAGALAVPATAGELGERLGGLSADAIAGMLALLLRAGMLGPMGSEGTCAADDTPALQSWEFHDLLFHARSRLGRTDAPCGGTYRLAGRLAPPPALKPRMAGESFELYRPDLERLQRDDPPLAWVQERRHSVRAYDSAQPLTARQLGEFLFRIARVKEFRQEEVTTPHGPMRMDFASRPYPAGGGLYELETYVVVSRCVNLEPGLYHYDPAEHQLIRLSDRTPEVQQMLRDAAESTGLPEDSLQVLLILAARFPRLAWKYESIAYALTLKHVGVVYQTTYLAATAMGLAPCAVGSGNADLFARAAGMDYYAETSVGEFLLGSQRREEETNDLDRG